MTGEQVKKLIGMASQGDKALLNAALRLKSAMGSGGPVTVTVYELFGWYLKAVVNVQALYEGHNVQWRVLGFCVPRHFSHASTDERDMDLRTLSGLPPAGFFRVRLGRVGLWSMVGVPWISVDAAGLAKQLGLHGPVIGID